MKFKNKIYTLLSIFTLVGLTHSFTLKDLNASLTAPASYDISFNGTSYTSSNGSSPTSVALFERTADGAYYNYYHRFRDTRLNPNHTLPAGSGMHSNPANYDLPIGLDITMEFNRSNTNWTIATPYNGYYNTDTKIGSDNNVGSLILAKYDFIFNNQTNRDYYLFFDGSSTGRDYNVISFTNNISDGWYYQSFQRLGYTQLSKIFLPAYTQLQFWTQETTGQIYFDAWYLKDLGQSGSYDVGYFDGFDQGYADGLGNNPNILLTGFQAMVGILVNLALMIANLEVFGVSLMGIFAIVVLFTGIVWTLKLIRG